MSFYTYLRQFKALISKGSKPADVEAGFVMGLEAAREILDDLCDKHDLPGLISKHFADKTRELEIGIGIG